MPSKRPIASRATDSFSTPRTSISFAVPKRHPNPQHVCAPHYAISPMSKAV
jgi:hypothetical protein